MSLLYPGSTPSVTALQPMVRQAEQLLPLTLPQRRQTLWRLDAGFGSDASLNWLLARDYQLMAKGYNARRAENVARALPAEAWQTVRANKWVALVPDGRRYARCTQTLALHWLTPSGKHKYALLIHTLLEQPALQVVHTYDQRGSLEVEIRQDKLGLQLLRRRKQRWGAQEAWVLLTDWAHNLLTWTADWMFAGSRFETYGYLRLVHDVLTMPGRLEFKGDKLHKVALQASHPFAPEMLPCLERLFQKLC